MAQFGSALDWGSRGRRFKSCRPDQKSKRESNRSPVFYEGRQPAQQAWTSSIGFEPKGSPKCYQALLARGSRLKSEACLDASELLRPDQKSKRESNRSPVFYEGRQPAQQAWTSSIGFEPKGSPKCYQALLARGSRLKSEACLDASELLRPDQLNTKERANALSLFVQETTACAAGMDFVTF